MNLNRQSLASAFSLIATPLILFISTSSGLYLKNQEELGYNPGVLLPFFIFFLAFFILSLILMLLAKYFSWAKYLLVLYFLLGINFLIFSYIRTLTIDPRLKIAVLLSLGLALLYLSIRKIKFQNLIYFFAFFSLLLIFNEAYQFVTQIETPRHSSEIEPQAKGKNQSGKPNIYHVILDEYQTEMFQLTLNAGIRKELKDFTFFSENRTAYARTKMSLPSMFTGRYYDSSSTQKDFQLSGLNSEASFLSQLKKNGYSTYLFGLDLYSFDDESNLFDKKSYHNKLSGHAKANADFMALWLFSNVPNKVLEQFFPKEILNQLKNDNFLPTSAPIISRQAFNKFLEKEGELPGSSRYTLVHLLIPHFPNVLRKDCSFDERASRSTPLEQSQCGAKIISELVEKLKDLGRYDNSLIIINGDHGSRYKLISNSLKNLETEESTNLEWAQARSKALLLVKPIRGSNQILENSNLETSLLDIFPTILDSLNIQTNKMIDGFSLLNRGVFPEKRIRYYYAYDKQTPDEWTDKLHQFIIQNGQILFVKDIPVKSN